MGKYMRKSKLMGGDVAVMEVAHHQVGVRTRARTLAMAAATASAAAVAAKKRKNNSSELPSSSYNIQLRSRCRLEIPPEKSKNDLQCSIQVTTRRRLDIETENSDSKSKSHENSERRSSGSVIPLNDRCLSPCSDNLPASRCSSNGSSMLMMNEKLMKSVVDLEGDGSEIENSRNSDIRARRETTPSSNLRVVESEDLASTEGLPMNRSTEGLPMMMPSEEEIDDFFLVPEKQELQRFEKKYNFDFVKEVPLEGRYEWVSLIQ